MIKTISIIGSMGIPSRYGGFETLTEQLSKYLCTRYNLLVFCSSLAYNKQERQKMVYGVTRIFLPIRANGISSIFYDIISMLIAGKKSDIMLILGSSGTIALPLIRLIFPTTKIIFHPDGVEWKRLKWNLPAKYFLYLSTKVGCMFSNQIILDNKKLKKHYKSHQGKIHYIAYGGDQYSIKQSEKPDYWLTIARAEKENNLEIIANSFPNLKDEKWVLLSNWRDTNHGRYLYKKFANFNNIIIIDANYQKKTLEEIISNCKGYIHGHSTGGTNPALVSAMWSGKRVVCHDNCFNRETTENLTDYFIDNKELIQLINDETAANNIEKLKLVACNKYSWEIICESYHLLFEMTIGNEE